jgi:hypothetical protein
MRISAFSCRSLIRPRRAIEQAGLADQEADAGEGALLRFQNDIRKPRQPIVDAVGLAGALQLSVIILAVAVDRFGERRERRRFDGLCERLLRDRAPYASVAIFERMDRLEPEVGDPCSGDRR